MSLRLGGTVVLVVAVVGGGFHAAPGNAASAQHVFAERGCAGCHGADGRQSADATPVLAGQNAGYLLRQMQDVAGGRRVAGPGADGQPRTKAMKDVMAGMGDEELRAMADWLATVPPPTAARGDAADAGEGADLFEEFGCMGCHGVDGLKPLSGYPILAGQNRQYLALQTKEIRDTVRTNGRSRVMVEFVHKVSDTQADRIAAYLSQISRSATNP
ncbi:MAG TPA: c-type cytochrome [Azospirillum sp.]|nr:c-type cytochrome [Azospirillum sp.]